MEANRPPHTADRPGLDRRTFLRRALCDARTEFAQRDRPSQIIEAGLLTAMGALGLATGFACLWQAEVADLCMTNRGMDEAAVACVQDRFWDLQHRCLASAAPNKTPFQSGVHVMDTDGPLGPPLDTSGLQLLIGWQMGSEMAGFIGLGNKLTGPFIEDEEIDFALNVIDHMVMTLQAVTARATIRTLESELQQAREQIREGTLRNEAAKKDLEQTLFRLSGFNDIFQELSGLHESSRVIESFLLVLIGIFSARSGSILYFDAAAGKACFAGRGGDSSVYRDLPPEHIRSQVDAVFETRRASALAPMQADIVPVEHLPGLSAPLAKESLVIIFKLDQAAKGLVCLGPRLVESRYGSRDREMLLAFTHNFLVFLKNSKSFETIQRLSAEQEQRNIALQQTVQELSASKITIATLEKAGERIKALITRAMARSTKASLVDICAVLVAGMVLGLVYNFASPGGIAVIPTTWRHASSPQVDIQKAEQLFNTQGALFVDARPPEFYNQRHITAAVNLPPALFDFIYMMRFSRMVPEQPFVVYGRTISRHYDEEIAYRLRDRGHPNVLVLTGGIGQWNSKGLPTEP